MRGKYLRPAYVKNEDFILIRAALYGYLHGFITFAYTYGWPVKEISSLTWEEVNRELWAVEIERNTMGRNIKQRILLTEELKYIFRGLWKEREKSQNKKYVFLNKGKTSRIVKIPPYEWSNAFRKTTINRFCFYDLRYTAVENFIKAGTTIGEISNMNIFPGEITKVLNILRMKYKDKDS